MKQWKKWRPSASRAWAAPHSAIRPAVTGRVGRAGRARPIVESSANVTPLTTRSASAIAIITRRSAISKRSSPTNWLNRTRASTMRRRCLFTPGTSTEPRSVNNSRSWLANRATCARTATALLVRVPLLTTRSAANAPRRRTAPFSAPLTAVLFAPSAATIRSRSTSARPSRTLSAQVGIFYVQLFVLFCFVLGQMIVRHWYST